jgi:hypothetical protein
MTLKKVKPITEAANFLGISGTAGAEFKPDSSDF